MKITFTLILITISSILNAQTLRDCSSCASKLITTEQIRELSIDEIRFLTNDLFARKGYVFQDSDIDAYYSEQEWYRPVTANYTLEYNDIEKQNIKLFQDRTQGLNAEREHLKNELKRLKTLVDNNNKKELQRQFRYKAEDNSDYIKNVLDEILLDDIHWFKKEGWYKVSRDNGDIIKEYALVINGDRVTFHFSIKGASGIGNGAALYPKAQITEISYSYIFEFRNRQLVFDKVIVAG